MLTKKQFELLKYIDSYLNIYGVSPSFDEMKDATKRYINDVKTGDFPNNQEQY